MNDKLKDQSELLHTRVKSDIATYKNAQELAQKLFSRNLATLDQNAIIDSMHGVDSDGDLRTHQYLDLVGTPSLPIIPLFDCFQVSSIHDWALTIPLLSSKEMIYLWDLSLWKKDLVDIHLYEKWLSAIELVDEKQWVELRKKVILKNEENIVPGREDLEVENISQFQTLEDLYFFIATSESFLLYLKTRFQIWTFDVEEPEYPEHNNYFLSDDQLLLFSYEDESYVFVDLVKKLIRCLYSRWGVETAYQFLFKMVAETYSYFSEEVYYWKKQRLQEFGIVDYYAAREVLTPYNDQKSIDVVIEKNRRHYCRDLMKKKGALAVDDVNELTQGTLSSSVVDHLPAEIREEKDVHFWLQSFSTKALEKFDEIKQKKIEFQFLQLMNSFFALDFYQSTSKLARTQLLNRMGSYLRLALEISEDFIHSREDLKELLHQSLGEGKNQDSDITSHLLIALGPIELYKISSSLFHIEKKLLSKSLDQALLVACEQIIHKPFRIHDEKEIQQISGRIQERQDQFWGTIIEQTLNLTFQTISIPKIVPQRNLEFLSQEEPFSIPILWTEGEEKVVENKQEFQLWKKQVSAIRDILPLVAKTFLLTLDDQEISQLKSGEIPPSSITENKTFENIMLKGLMRFILQKLDQKVTSALELKNSWRDIQRIYLVKDETTEHINAQEKRDMFWFLALKDYLSFYFSSNKDQTLIDSFSLYMNSLVASEFMGINPEEFSEEEWQYFSHFL